jgi:hypothetical protein
MKCGAVTRGQFCSQCGAPTGIAAEPLAARERRGWTTAAIAVGLLALVLVWAVAQKPATPPAAPAAVGESGSAAAPPDLSTMSAREQFDRLYNRVMQAAESGDTATVSRFAPMAFTAYGRLDSVNADARYHAAVLTLHVRSDTAGALRLADSILAESPRHLLGYLIRGTAARLSGNNRLLGKAYGDFLAAWDAETKAGRPEYLDHRTMLDQFRASAVAAGYSSTGKASSGRAP